MIALYGINDKISKDVTVTPKSGRSGPPVPPGSRALPASRSRPAPSVRPKPLEYQQPGRVIKLAHHREAAI